MRNEIRHYVLSLMMTDLRFLSTCSVILLPRYFESPLEQHLSRIMINHFKEFHTLPGKPVIVGSMEKYLASTRKPTVTIEEVHQALDSMSEIQQEAALSTDYIHKETLEFCRKRALTEVLISVAADLEKEEISDSIKERVEKALYLGADLSGGGIFWLKDAPDSTKGVGAKDARITVKTGLPWIDEPLVGGLGYGEAMIVASPPHTGKTTGLVNIGVGAVKNRKKVAHYTLEMSETSIRSMYDKCLLRMSGPQISSWESEECEKIVKHMQKLSNTLKADALIKQFPMHKLSMAGMKAHLLMLESQYNFKPDVVIVDYLDLMEMPTHIHDDVRKITWVGEEFRSMCVERGYAGVTASQINREGSKKETAEAVDLAGDYQKVMWADHICTFNQTKDEYNDQEMRIVWIKCRAGAKYRTFKVYTDFTKAILEPA